MRMLLQMIARKAAVAFLILLAAFAAASADERDDGRPEGLAKTPASPGFFASGLTR